MIIFFHWCSTTFPCSPLPQCLLSDLWPFHQGWVWVCAVWRGGRLTPDQLSSWLSWLWSEVRWCQLLGNPWSDADAFLCVKRQSSELIHKTDCTVYPRLKYRETQQHAEKLLQVFINNALLGLIITAESKGAKAHWRDFLRRGKERTLSSFSHFNLQITLRNHPYISVCLT